MTSFVHGPRHLASCIGLLLVSSAYAAPTGAQSPRDASARLRSASNRPASSVAAPGAPTSIVIESSARRVLVGATVPHTARVRDAAGAEHRDVAVRWTTSDPNVASINQFGALTAVRPGPVTVRAAAGSLIAERKYVVESNPVKSLTLSITADQVKTGDVVEVSAMAFDGAGYKVPNVPFLYTFTAVVEDTAIGQMAPAELDQQGRFVAQQAGDYQIIAVAPGLVAHRTIRVANRDLAMPSRLVARLPMTSPAGDAAGWRGLDGRSYVLACGGTPAALVSYDVTDGAFRALDTATVNTRAIATCTVNGTTGMAAVVRESAAGRGGITLLDVSDPRAIKALGSMEDGLGAISRVAIAGHSVFTVSDGRRLDVVSIDDPAHPRRIGSIDLAPGRAAAGSASVATDVSVSDGFAYVALGRAGMAIVDVGNGKFGGTAAKPVRVGAFHAPFSSTHAAYGFRSRTGKWYVVASEDLPEVSVAAEVAIGEQPGFARIIDFTDPAHPAEVARYEVPEAGVQDLWVDRERLYVAAQTGGLRVVDIGADLKGNLYHQGREITRFTGVDSTAVIPNVVSVQPVGDAAIAVDRNSGLWLVSTVPARAHP